MPRGERDDVAAYPLACPAESPSPHHPPADILPPTHPVLEMRGHVWDPFFDDFGDFRIMLLLNSPSPSLFLSSFLSFFRSHSLFLWLFLSFFFLILCIFLYFSSSHTQAHATFFCFRLSFSVLYLLHFHLNLITILPSPFLPSPPPLPNPSPPPHLPCPSLLKVRRGVGRSWYFLLFVLCNHSFTIFAFAVYSFRRCLSVLPLFIQSSAIDANQWW